MKKRIMSGLMVSLSVTIAACGGSSRSGDPDPVAPDEMMVTANPAVTEGQPVDDPPSDNQSGDNQPGDNQPGDNQTPLPVDRTKLALVDSFSTRGGIGLAFDRFTDTIWTFGGTTFRQYDREGNLLLTLNPEAGESANDADLDFADADLVLGETDIQAGTLMYTNGESDTADIYAIGSDGSVFSTLITQFGNSHVVGSAYSVPRGTFFMLQDNVPAVEINNLVAEVDPVTGEVLASFDLDELENPFNVFFGDLEVDNETGNLLIVSTAESEILRLTPEGAELARLTLAEGSEGSLAASGIALDEARGELYVQSNSGVVSRFSYTE